jgi:hypothetical protein
MADPMTGPITSCPWCSAPLSDPGAESCPTCGATLVSQTGGADPEIKGVTTLDPEAILRARAAVARPKSRLFSFITGESAAETGSPASPESLARPPAEVRREMLRLELEAQQAELEAESVALKSDVIARQGIHVSQLGGVQEDAPAIEDANVAEGDAAVAPVVPTYPDGAELDEAEAGADETPPTEDAPKP